MESETEQIKDKIFILTQKYLKECNTIIWGSGATIPYGLPSMDDLKKDLNNITKIKDEENLESGIEKIKDENVIAEIRKIISNIVFQKDIECLLKAVENPDYFKTINKMIDFFYTAHPHNINIITTNYDRVLEYALSQEDYKYTDGFSGKVLSIFDSDNCFKETGIINLFKVHGSLNWVDNKNEIFFLPFKNKNKNLKNVMVLPRNSKYKEVSEEPYRTLIAESDKIIKKAKSFFVVGFGFNDEHLTPLIEKKIKEGIPIVIIVKKATLSCKKKLEAAKKYCLFEESKDNTTIVTYKESDKSKVECGLKEKYWELKKFMEIVCKNKN